MTPKSTTPSKSWGSTRAIFLTRSPLRTISLNYLRRGCPREWWGRDWRISTPRTHPLERERKNGRKGEEWVCRGPTTFANWGCYLNGTIWVLLNPEASTNKAFTMWRWCREGELPSWWWMTSSTTTRYAGRYRPIPSCSTGRGCISSWRLGQNWSKGMIEWRVPLVSLSWRLFRSPIGECSILA